MNQLDYTILKVKVSPHAKVNAIIGWEKEILKVRIHAAPEKGAANRELIRFLANALSVPASTISLLSGNTNRLKRLRILLAPDELKKRLNFPKKEA